MNIPQDELSLARILIQAGMARLGPDRLVKRDLRGRARVAGRLDVPHKETTDRLIMDRRPENSAEIRLPGEALRYSNQLIRLVGGFPGVWS